MQGGASDRTDSQRLRESLSWQARMLPLLTRPTMRFAADRLDTGASDVRRARWIFDTLGGAARPPKAFVTTASESGGVPTRWYSATAINEQPRSVILHVHGGGFIFGSQASHSGLVSWLARHAGHPVCLPLYRRAPEHLFPAAHDDVLAVYDDLIAEGTEAHRIGIVGDSAGCHIVGSALTTLSREKRQMPGAVVMMSPFLDLTTATMAACDRRRRDPLASPSYAARAASVYLGPLSPDDRTVDILSAEVSKWPPTLVQVGGTECMQGEAEKFVERLCAAGVEATMQVWPGQVHVFQGLAGVLPEGRRALKDAGLFLANHLAGG